MRTGRVAGGVALVLGALALVLLARLATPTASARVAPCVGAAALVPPIVAADPPPSPEPKAPADGPSAPKPAKPSMTMEDFNAKIMEHKVAFASMVLLKYGAGLAGLIVAILALVRRRDQERGLLPPPRPSCPPPSPIGVAPALLLVLFAVFGGGVVVDLGRKLGWSSAEDGGVPLMQGVLATAACTIPAALIAYAAIRWRRRETGAVRWSVSASIGLGLLVFLVASAAVIVLSFVGTIVLWAFGHAPAPQDLIVRLLDPKARADLLVVTFFGVVVAPITEECLFRGLLFTAVREGAGVRVAAVVQAILFAAVHGDLTAALPLFGLALFLAWVYQRTGSLVAPILVHSLNNATSLVPLLLSLA